MIVLSRVFPATAGAVADVAWRPRDRKLARFATGKARPWITRRAYLDDARAPAGFVAVFVEDEWPKHVLYAVATDDEARELAAADLTRLTAPWPARWYLDRRMGAGYWAAAPADPGRAAGA